MNIRILVTIFLVSIFFISKANAKEITLSTHNLPHYGEFIDPNKTTLIANDAFRGKAVDVVRCALDKLDYTPTIRVVPWQRAQHEAKIGTSDGFFAAAKSEERDSYATLSTAIADMTWSWFILDDARILPEDSAFKKEAKIGSFQGSNFEKYLENNNYNITLKTISSRQLIDILLHKRIDAILASDVVMAEIIKPTETNIRSIPLKNTPLGVYFSKEFLKQTPGFLEQFNQQVKVCRAN